MIKVKDIQNFYMLKNTITCLIDFDCHKYTDTFIMRRIEVRLSANKLDSYLSYITLLKTDKDERERLNKELTIHTTNFFRDIAFWNVFIKEVIPIIISLKRGKEEKKIRVWSAGCSTGEEPLSIAISFNEALRMNIEKLEVEITATDIDNDTINAAKQGVYNEQQFREMPPRYKEKYFEKVDEEGFYVPKSNIKDMITYRKGDGFSPI